MDSRKEAIIHNLQAKLTTVPKEEILPFFLATYERLQKEKITFSKEELQEFIKVFESQASDQELKQIRLIKEIMS